MVHNLKPHSRDQSPTLGNLNILKRGKGTKPRTLRIIPSPKIGLLKNGLAMQPYFQVREPSSLPCLVLLHSEWSCCTNYRPETF